METTEDQFVSFARRMVETWKGYGLSEAQLAEFLGLDLETVRRLWRGEFSPLPAIVVWIAKQRVHA